MLTTNTAACLELYRFQTYLTSSGGQIQLATCKARQLLLPHPESRQPSHKLHHVDLCQQSAALNANLWWRMWNID